MHGVNLSAGNALGVTLSAAVPLIGLTRRIAGEERELIVRLPG